MYNEGANCGNCLYRGQRYSGCRKCIEIDGHRGWEPDEGVQVEYFEAYTGPKLRKHETIRRVKYDDVIPF